ncbi:BON domain-containing protein [Lentzea sp. NPDC051838]|uniref:BON domain-containing protein n=1 Tax=Lentzea sp. NPDC051838 TaxID=3154849 RepID=UPI003427EFEF
MESEQYLAANLRRTVAEDPRTAELGVRIVVRGDHAMVSGDVACEDRRRALEEVLHEVAPELTILNDVRVTPAGEPDGEEDLR